MHGKSHDMCVGAWENQNFVAVDVDVRFGLGTKSKRVA